MRPHTLRAMARRNGVPLADLTDEGIEALYQFTDFPGFIAAWVRCSDAVRTGDDLRRLVVDYAEEAGGHGAVYVEAIISPAETVRRGHPRGQALLRCHGRRRRSAGAPRRDRAADPGHPARLQRGGGGGTVRTAARFRDRGVVAIGLGGLEKEYPPEAYAPAFGSPGELGAGVGPRAR